MGNLYQSISDKEASDTISAAISAGMRYFDTAPFYGFGLSERRIGDGLRGSGAIISSKVGRLLVPQCDFVADEPRHGFVSPIPFAPLYDYTYDGIIRSWRESLQRLGLARIDILYVHDIGRLTHGDTHDHTFNQLTRGGGLRALEELRAQGEIAAFGIGVNEIEICTELLQIAALDCILLAGRYTLLEQEALDLLIPMCAAKNCSLVIGGAYNSGILATGTKSEQTAYYNYQPAPENILARVRRIEDICADHDVSLAAAALQFPLAHPLVKSVIPGLGSAGRIAQTMALFKQNIPADFWQELKQDSLIRKDAPVPGEPG